MSENQVRFKFKTREVEVEYEGIGALSKENVLELTRKFIELHAGIASSPTENSSDVAPLNEETTDQESEPKPSFGYITARLKAKSTTELAIAACAKLTLFDQKNVFSRNDILETMKQDSGRYKKSMSSNLGKSIKILTKNLQINEISKNHYALSSDERNSLEAKLVET